MDRNQTTPPPPACSKTGNGTLAGPTQPAPPPPAPGALARCLEPPELEQALLGALLARLPGATALVCLNPEDRSQARIAGPEGFLGPEILDQSPPLLAYPIVDMGETLGWIGYLEDGLVRAHREWALGGLIDISREAGIPARNTQRHALALEMALRDPLTGLYNRRAFEAFLQNEESGARRYGRTLTVMLLDLDHFKDLNDRFGHLAGDRALQGLASLLVKTVRRSDIVARVGGDEFAILLPDTAPDDAARLGRRLLKVVAGTPLELGEDLPQVNLGLSMGLAGLSPETPGDQTIIQQADLALYQAKREGRGKLLRAKPKPGTQVVPIFPASGTL